MNKLLQTVIRALGLLLVLAVPALPQATDGNLVGAVTDQSGGAVLGASVELQNMDTGVLYTATSDNQGVYRFNNIPIGQYSVTVKATGFSTRTLKGVAIELNKTASANISLEVGRVTTSVEVSAAGMTIDTTTAQVGSNFSSRQIVNMPIIENSTGLFGALNLSLLSAGVTSNGGVGQGTGPSIGGQRPMNNNFTIEGVDNNNKTVTGPLVYVPTEATAEFTVLQNQFAAEFGHSSGGQFNTVVKSGTNEFHGSLYEYFQNRNLNAVDQAFARQGFRDNLRYDQNRLGGSIGGPIRRNKLFFFGSFEYAPLGVTQVVTTPVYAPTAQGFATLDQMVNRAGYSKVNYDVFKAYVSPAPVASDAITVGGASVPVGVLPIPGLFYSNQYSAVGSVDYNLSDRDQLRGRFIYNKNDSLDNLANLPAFWTTLPQRFYLSTISHYHTFTPTLTNELRLGYNRFSQYYVVPDFQFPGLDQFPNLTIYDLGGINLGPDGNAPQYSVQNTYQLVENLSWTKGRHTLKFGYDGRNVISPQHFIQRERGDYYYTTLDTYLQDLVPDDFAERNLGDTNYYGNQWAHYLYANDNWRLRPNLTLNLGLRWELTTVPVTQKLQRLNAVSDASPLITFGEPRVSTKNFAPRIGIAYSPGTSGNTSIRAGFGMAYDVIFDNVGSTAYPPQLSSTFDANNHPDIFTAPFLARGGIYPGSIASGGTLSQAEARAATSSYIYDQVLPYSLQWNFGVQQVLGKNYTFEARYLGTRGVHLLVQQQINKYPRITPDRYLPTYFTAPSQAQLDSLAVTLPQLLAASNNPVYGPLGFSSNITAWPPVGNSHYHGLALQLNRRFAAGWQLVGSYTWSHNIDDSTATHFSTVLTPRRAQDFQSLRPEVAASALDRRHRLTLNAIWESSWFNQSDNWLKKNLAGNWRIVGTYTKESPEYATVQSGTDSNLNGDSASDRAIINPAGDEFRGSDVRALANSLGQTVAYLALDPGARYITAGQGALANGGRNTLATRGINNFDVSFGKRFNVSENRWVEFRGDFSNLFNHPQYTPGYINSVRLTSMTNTRTFLFPSDRNFGDWSQIFASNARSVQLALRFVF